VKRLEPSRSIEFTSHALGPEAVLAICQDTYKRTPEALLVAVRGYSFEFAEGLSEKARQNKSKALEYIKNLIDQWRGKKHGS
jgi:Ni,Fe-hydrogenase maturation factor